jgi:signal transduction histidine kinase
MVTEKVEQPALKGIIYRFLLAHAEQPALLKDSEHHSLREFSQRPPFYDEFIQQVARTVPAFREQTEQKLLDKDSWTSQADFKAVLACFKDISGIHNPHHYHELGRIIPRVGDGLTALAATAGNPRFVIQQSPRYNRDFNNDQFIAVERLSGSPRRVEATIQHYFLPSSEEPYLEMVTAALGYWEGIPALWDFEEVGTTHLKEVQLTLQELIERDYAYLHLHYAEDEHSGDVSINGRTVAKKVSLDDVLEYVPSEQHLAQPLERYQPVIMTESFIVDDEVIFPKGTVYGMPCNRYDVEVPHPGAWKRFVSALELLPRLISRKKDARGFFFLGKRPREITYSDQLRATQLVAFSKLEAEREAAIARADAAEARLTLEQQVSRVNETFGDLRTLAHDNKNYALTLLAEARTLTETLTDSTEVSAYVNRITPILNEMIENDRIIMRGGIPIDIVETPYDDIMKPIIESIRKVYPDVAIHYHAPPAETIVRGDVRLLKAAFTNIISNAVEASQPDGSITITQRQVHRAKRTFTIIDINQTGYLSEEHAEKLNRGERFTTKPNGNATGASASYNIITGPHNGSIRYESKGEEGATVRIII